MSEVTVRYASTDDDVILIHRFLCIYAGPLLPGPIDAQKSAIEVWRVAVQDVALMAIQDGQLIGTLGPVFPEHWWSKLKFSANRWFFCAPGSKAWLPLLREAKAIAVGSGFELHIISEGRGKILILNKSKHRKGAVNVLRQHESIGSDQSDPAS
jgi:hypothetical protein